jgi:hypothetical protein
MTIGHAGHGGCCPVCGGRGESFLELPNQPVYQHPVPAGACVPQPHLVDLVWDACSTCAHAWQPNFDAEQLRNIYRSHYYTPAPSGIGVQFRQDFLQVLQKQEFLGAARVLLEIGAADGDVLAELKRSVRTGRAYAFEPNRENAAVARSRGLEVRESFFGADTDLADLEPADLIYARHVIEHVFDFAGFFAAVASAAAADARLILETPSLDFHAAHGSIQPFHIEHVHVFALRSLARLGCLYGWGMHSHAVTPSGNLIATFSRTATTFEPAAPELADLAARLERTRTHLRELLAGRPLIFWGAGSAGIVLSSMLEREPDVWTDGNPNKIGKHYVGCERAIVAPETALGFADPGVTALVVTSSFVNEILPRVLQLGWRGDIYGPAGEVLQTRK